MSETVYLETSVIGYLTARSTSNAIVAANIAVTKEWWKVSHNSFEFYISQVVIDEISRGDAEVAAKRLELVQSFRLLKLDLDVRNLAKQFLARSNLPPKAANDALHISIATVRGIDYLLTWNCKHIANARIQRKLSEVALDVGYSLPTICTPYELKGD